LVSRHTQFNRSNKGPELMYKHHELYSSRSDEDNPFSIFRARDY
jgi:hypothetical protein